MSRGARGLRPDEVEIGKVVGIFGVRGEVRLHMHHRDSDLLTEERECVLIGRDGERRSVHLSARSGAGRRVLGKLRGVEDRSAARALMGQRIAIDKAQLPTPQADEFYVWAVRGLPVVVEGATVGTVVEVHTTPGGDVMEVDTSEGPVFLPMIRQVVQQVDVEGGTVVVEPDAWNPA